MAISDWIHNGVGAVAQDTSIYKSGAESVKLYNMGGDAGTLLLNKSGMTNIGEGMLVTWARTDYYGMFHTLYFRAKSSKGYTDIGYPKDCYLVYIRKANGYLYKYINGSSQTLAEIGGHGFNENTWFMLRVKWYKDNSGNLVIVVDKSADGSTWTNIAVVTDTSPSFEGDTERKVGVGGRGDNAVWFDLTKVYKA